MNRVKEVRLSKGLSQEELSSICGIPRTTISAIESGKVNPSVEHAIRIARALGVSVEDLFGNEPVVSFTEGLRGPFVSAKVEDRIVLYPLSSLHHYVEPDGQVEGESVLWKEKSKSLFSLTIATCDPFVSSLHQSLYPKGIRLIPLYSHSLGALELLRKGLVHMAGVHLGSLEENFKVVRDLLGKGYRVMCLFEWEEGLAYTEDFRKPNLVWLVKEKGSGSWTTFEIIEKRPANIKIREFKGGHRELIKALINNLGHVAISIKPLSVMEGLSFYTIRRKDYCIVYPEGMEKDRRFATFLELLRSKSYKQSVEQIPGLRWKSFKEVST
ncbi:helix-turn-helix domain-containing protein [Thermocrinis minervae]|uniref:Transcriptional regulator of molybdate metabolism, XRE family n=1 Tax=Thermocrinis minervae TaxID=381751 RepID=A0A1M6SLA9_9AQUI|nr:helix-turn-helix domain-containing protein [Thermocrinis minervae]SHK45436.1 transcriptional regulator of molybdate metabolism, XRE family [Thermocrinis minervae]